MVAGDFFQKKISPPSSNRLHHLQWEVYVEAPDFEILLFGYSIDSGPVQVIDLACGEKILEKVLEALTDDTVIKWAFNANFERICLSQHLKNIVNFLK